MKPRYARLKCADCGVPWADHAKDPRRLCFVLENTTAEEVRQHIAALTVLVDQLRAAYADAQERIQALDPLPLPMYHNRMKVERLAPAVGPGGAPVSFGWKVGWVADELVRVRTELEGLRAKLAELAGRYPKPHLRLLSSDIARPPDAPAVPAWAPETWRMAIIGNAATWVDLETTADVVGYAAPGGNAADWTALLMMLRAGTPGRASKRLAWHAELGIYCFRNHREGLATPFQFRREEAPAVAAWLEEKLAELRVGVAVPVLDDAP